jgi:catechol 2,3-dioxygenase-like lactoylglutathione lyase family enzyme
LVNAKGGAGHAAAAADYAADIESHILNRMSKAFAFTRRDFFAGTVWLSAAHAARGWAGALPVAGLDHLNLHVPDVRRSADFYTKLFGVEVARAPNAAANPGSKPAELWFIRLGQSFLAISPTPPQERPGIDHYCFAIEGFNGAAMKPRLTGFNQPWPDTPPGNLWVKDAGGYIVQMSAGADRSRVPGAGVGSVLVEPPGGAKREPAFQATRIAQLVLVVPKLEASASFYRKLLGAEAEKQKRRFRVGPSELVLGPVSGGESFRVGMASFDPGATARKLTDLGVAPQVARDNIVVSFRDPDGIKVQIGA